MKLFLMRHAEAKPLNHQDDRLRELTEKGIKEAEEAATFLQKYKIDKILVSNAVRTIQTGEIIRNKINSAKFEICPQLYSSTSEDIIELICQQDDQNRNILVIAHNPGILNAALELVEYDSPEYELIVSNGMPTARIIKIELDNISSWQNLINF
jgi:phosphohistidine phosphatase